MKKTVIASVAFAAALFAVSCQKETNPVQNVSGPMTISAVSEGLNTPTKTELAFKYDVLWSSTDKIYVVDGQGNNDTFSLKRGVGTTKGTFEQDGDVTFDGEVQAYYPATMLQSGSPVWPASQTNDQTIPMYCKKTLSSGGQGEQRMDFSSLGSVLRIAFTTPVSNIKLKSITIKDDETKMSGIFTVEDGKAIVNQSAGTNSITLDLGDDGVDVSNKINYFNIAVPAGHYKKFSITFTAKDGKLCVMTGGNINIDHNTVGALSLTGKEFNPFGQGEAAVSETAEVQGNKVKWIQLWENGPKFAEVNVGVTDGKAESYGGYYCWGKTTNKDGGGSYKEGESVLTGTDDTATALWGENWRMPTQAELEALLNTNNCTCTWTTNYNGTGVNGLLCTGKGDYASNSVFLPADGYWSSPKVWSPSTEGYYWSSSPYTTNKAYRLYFYSGGPLVGKSSRGYGCSVRAVLAK